jgi:hypothetical protein
MPFKPRDNLDDELLKWSKADPWTGRHACTNVVAFGQTGSGKSSGSLMAIQRALAAYRNSGGLILASKKEDKATAIRIFREAGRLKDLLIMEPNGEYRCNILNHERHAGADTPDLTQACMTLKETQARTQGGGAGENAAFFAGEERRMIYNGIEILLRATGQLDPWSLYCFITGAALALEELKSDEWQAGFHNKMLQLAKTKASTDIEKHDVQLAEQYWTSEIPRMNDKTRTSIEAGVLGGLHGMNSGVARDLLATTTNISPDTLEDRKWWFLNAPIVPGDQTSVVLNTAVKYAVQRHILRREAGPQSPLLAIISDEFQKVANSYDAMFLAECRSHKGFLIAATQSIHSMYANIHGKGGEHQTDSLLTNFGTVIIHSLGDAKSAQYASSLLGNHREIFINTSMQPRDEELFDVIMGRTQASVSCSEKYEPLIQPSVFQTGLRCGGTENGNIVDGVIIRSGRPFSTGKNYIIASFKQR